MRPRTDTHSCTARVPMGGWFRCFWNRGTRATGQGHLLPAALTAVLEGRAGVLPAPALPVWSHHTHSSFLYPGLHSFSLGLNLLCGGHRSPRNFRSLALVPLGSWPAAMGEKTLLPMPLSRLCLSSSPLSSSTKLGPAPPALRLDPEQTQASLCPWPHVPPPITVTAWPPSCGPSAGSLSGVSPDPVKPMQSGGPW